MEDLYHWLRSGCEPGHFHLVSRLVSLGVRTISKFNLKVVAYCDALFLKSDIAENWHRYVEFTVEFCNCTQIRLLKIYFVPSCMPMSKYFPKHAKLNYCHINSGMCTTISPNEKAVYIFRNQEMSKVLFHELLHAFQAHDTGVSQQLSKRIDDLMNALTVKHTWIKLFQSRILFFEAIVEAIACILEHKRINSDVDGEILHSRRLCDIFLRWGYSRKNKFNERSCTHAIEYIVFKHILFKEWIRLNMDELQNLLPFTNKNMESIAHGMLHSFEFQCLCSGG